jgi:hypothetical protein
MAEATTPQNLGYATAGSGQPTGWLTRVLAEPIGWPTHLLAIVAMLWVWWDARYPGTNPAPWDFLAWLLNAAGWGLMLWLWIAAVWVLRLLAMMIVRRWLRRPVLTYDWTWPRWGVAPALLLVTFFVVSRDWPARAAWAVSKAEMERIAKEQLAGSARRDKTWVGVIPISGIRLEQGVVQFTYARREAPWGQRGILYNPAGTPGTSGHYYSQRPLPRPGWYVWHYGGW